MQDKNKKSGIYCIENIVTNKKYIGQSVDIDTRWKKHKYELNRDNHKNKYLQSAWNKYGEDKFKFYILELCSEEELDEKEIYWIEHYNTVDRELGYNLKTGGSGGCKFTDEVREHLSQVHKEICKDPEERKRMKQMIDDLWANEEYRKSRSGENHPLYGKHHSEETKKKLSESLKGRKGKPLNEKQRKAISEAHKGKEPPNKILIPVRCVELGLEFSDAITAGRSLNIKSPNHVIDVCQGRRQTCGGYHWEFVNQLGNNIS